MSEARSLNGVAASIADFRSAFRRGLFCHHSVEKSEIRSGASVKKVREAFQDSLSISGFAPFAPPLLEKREAPISETREFKLRFRFQGSIAFLRLDPSISISAPGPEC